MAWGVNQQGQLGDGNHKSSSTPVAVSELPRLVTRVVGIAAGDYHSLAFGPAPAPTLMKLSPLTGSVQGTPVAITGTNLLGATAVKFGATNATSLRLLRRLDCGDRA